ncbi:hypothetical protein [Streptomyces sp. TRM49041]|uniref:hypothetical protein n=1 Tax=Streptomyces sp. TRM49041 TaxID=2603216 RepID=UPI0011EBE772|nr:hypothetical protein [Streptomyces sp. TRM49041]
MSDNQPVNPAEIPVFTGDEAALDAKVKAISGHGVKVAAAAGDVHTTFGGLRAFYQAPEADQLFATTRPVADKALTLSSDMCVIAGALGTYANDIRPLAQELDRLKREAETFRSRIAGDDEWREDGDLIDENRARRDQIAELWTQFQEAERACHSKIVALVGGTPLKVNDGSNAKDMYGYDAEALKQAESLPWGDVVDESIPGWQFWEHGWEFGKGVVVDGVWGTLVGLGTLAGFKGGDAAGEAWSGLAALGTGLGLSMLPATRKYLWDTPPDQLPAEFRKARTAVQETGKAFLAWDKWESNPSRAAGEVTFNVLTTVFTGGAGGAAAGAGKAGAVAKALSVAGKAGRAIDPTTYAFKGASGLMKIGDVMTGLENLGKIEVPKFSPESMAIPEGAYKLPDGTLHLPEGAPVPAGAITIPEGTVRLPKGTPVPADAIDFGDGMVKLPEGTTPPAGAVQVPAGTLKIPEGTLAFPPGTAKLTDLEGNSVYVDKQGNLLDADSSLKQHHSQATPENPTAGADISRAETPPKTPALVGAGANTADNTAGNTRLGDSLADAGRTTENTPTTTNVGDDAPGGMANHLPGSSAGNNFPANSLDNNEPGNGVDKPTLGSPAGQDPPTNTADGHGSSSTGGHGRDHVNARESLVGGSEAPGGGDRGGSNSEGGSRQPANLIGNWAHPEQPRPFQRGGETEAQIRDRLRGSKVKPGDLDKTLANLADHPAGQEMADLIASGRFSGLANYDQVVSSFTQKNGMSGGVEQLRLAKRLQDSGMTDIGFEIKKDVEIKPGVTTGPKTDLDVKARDSDGKIYGYQFKEIANPKKVANKMWQNIGQLADSGADVKVFVVDTKGSIADMLATGIQKDLARIHAERGVIVVLRVEDGTLMYPPGANFMPGGRL